MESEEIDYERMQVGTSFGWAFSLASVFGFAAGYVDANTRKRFGTFGSLMTGNAVQLGTSIVGGNWLEAGLCMITLTAFGSGLLLAAHIIHLGVAGRESLVEFEVGSEKKAKDITQDLPTCMRLQAGFLISFALMSADVLFWALDPHGSIDPRFASAFAAFAMGLQNVFTLQGALHQNTSLLGGSLQQLAFICYRCASNNSLLCSPYQPVALVCQRSYRIASTSVCSRLSLQVATGRRSI